MVVALVVRVSTTTIAAKVDGRDAALYARFSRSSFPLRFTMFL
jgi:hypothetical protein